MPLYYLLTWQHRNPPPFPFLCFIPNYMNEGVEMVGVVGGEGYVWEKGEGGGGEGEGVEMQ